MAERDCWRNDSRRTAATCGAVAYRMLGSLSEADDAVQEAWLRLSRADAGGVDNLGGWLTTVVARVCLDMLRSRTARREDSLDARAAAPIARRGHGNDPEQEALLADSVGLALLVVLDTLTPAERSPSCCTTCSPCPSTRSRRSSDRSPAAARQLASRARRRVHRGADTGLRRRSATASARWSTPSSPPRAAATSQRCWRCSTPTSCCAPRRRRAHRAPCGRCAARRPWPESARGGRGSPNRRSSTAPSASSWRRGTARCWCIDFTIRRGRIAAIDVVADPQRLDQLDLAVLRN